MPLFHGKDVSLVMLPQCQSRAGVSLSCWTSASWGRSGWELDFKNLPKDLDYVYRLPWKLGKQMSTLSKAGYFPQSVSQPVSKKGMELLGQLKNSPCPREDTSPSWKFSHGCCLPTRSSSGSRGRRDSWDGKVKLPGESIFLTISNNIMITWRLDSCTPPNADPAGEIQQPGSNSTATCPYFVDVTSVMTIRFTFSNLAY